MASKYFIMAWDDDSDKRYYDFYFVAGENGNLLLFETVKEAEDFGHKTCKYFNIGSWHSYMIGQERIRIKRLILKEKE